MADVAFAISLQDQLSPGAKSAAQSLGQTEAALKRTGAAGDSVAGKMARTGTAAQQASGKTVDLGKAAKGAVPALGEMQERLSNLGSGLGGLSAGTTAAVLGIGLVVAAAAAAAAALLAFGLASADAAQHVRAMAIAQAGSVEAGKALAGTIQQVAGATAMGSEKVAGFARELGEAKLSSSEMRAALEAASGTARVLGDSAGSAFVKSAIEAKKAGKSVTAFAAEAKAKLGPGLAMELARPSVAAERLGQSIAGLFGDADVSGFGAAINMVSDALAKGSAVGDAFRAIFEAIFGGLGGNAQSAGSMVTAVLEEMTIWALKTAIFFKPLVGGIGVVWDKMMAGGGAVTTLNLVKAGVVAMGAAFVAAGVMAVIALAPVAASVLAATWPVLAIGAAVMALAFIWFQFGDSIKAAVGAGVAQIQAFGASVVKGFASAWAAISGFAADAWAALAGWASSALEAAGNFISGLVGGITGGAGMVIDAIKGLASSALGAFKGILGIASPSRVMLQMGGYTAEGFAGGMDAGAAVVESSASTLAAAPIEAAKAAPPADLPAARAAGGGGGGSIDIGGVTITINGVAGAENILERLPAALADAFEQIAETMGIQPAEA